MLFILFALVASSSYAFAPAGTISGTVTDNAGNPIEGINVYASDVGSGTGGYITTDTNGKYTISNLPAGDYRIEFFDYSKGFVSEYFDNATYDNPTLITLADGETKTADAKLDKKGVVHGKVTDINGNPIKDVWVSAQYYTDYGDWWDYVDYAYTDENGEYVFENGISAGTYRFKFQSNSQGFEYYKDATTIDDAQDVMIANNDDKTIDVVLGDLPSGTITGTVIDINNIPINNVWVSAQYYDTEYKTWFFYSGVPTNENGEYIFSLVVGTYRFKFQSNSQGFEYYKDATTIEGAQDVVISYNEDKTIDVVLGDLASGTITGTVTDNAGNPIEGIYIFPSLKVGDGWEYGFSTATDSDGKYSISNLPVGDYSIEFYDNTKGFVSEVFDKASYNNPTLITLADGETKTADAKLDKKGVVHGKVTDINGNPIKDIWVSAQYYIDSGYWPDVGGALTNENGEYIFSYGLDAGTYRFKFQSNSQGLEYYKDATTIEDALDVVINNYEDKTINIIWGAPDEFDSLTGIIKDSNGNLLANVSVKAYQSNNGDWSNIGENDFITETSTDNDGRYTFKDLADGTYRISFDTTAVASHLAAKNGAALPYFGSIEYYKDASSLVKATDIIITGGQVTSINDVIIGALDDKSQVAVWAIPTLQQWSIILLIILLFMISWQQSRIRNQQHL